MAERHQGTLSEEIKKLARGANFGHLATLMRDGAPHVDPGGSISRTSASSFAPVRARSRRRTRNATHPSDLSVIAMDNPYQEAQLRGRVVEQRSDRDSA